MTRSGPPGAYLTPSASLGSALRQQAEGTLLDEAASTPQPPAALSAEAAQRTLHELRVHQIELQAQNEELRRSQAALDATKVRYFSLYDMAPAGHCSVTHRGLVFEANFAAAALLGWARGALIGQPISHFIFQPDQDAFYLLGKRIAEGGVAQCCELRMVKADGKTAWVRLVAATRRAADGAPGLRMVLVDLSERG